MINDTGTVEHDTGTDKENNQPETARSDEDTEKCAEEKTNPEPQYQVDYIDNLMEARLLAPVTVTDMSGRTKIR